MTPNVPQAVRDLVAQHRDSRSWKCTTISVFSHGSLRAEN